MIGSTDSICKPSGDDLSFILHLDDLALKLWGIYFKKGFFGIIYEK